jgi:hypothetical protein
VRAGVRWMAERAPRPAVSHQTLRVTPAMEAGVSDHVWSVEEIVALLS